MNKLVPPICLLLALASFAAAFIFLSAGKPDVSVELQVARAQGDLEMREILETRLQRRQRSRNALIGGLFTVGVFLVVVAFASMRPAHQPRKPGSSA